MYRIAVFQQNGSAEAKIRGILAHGRGLRIERVMDVTEDLPEVIENPESYLGADFDADLVLDFFKHPDLSQALAALCRRKNIFVVASGKKIVGEGVAAPPT